MRIPKIYEICVYKHAKTIEYIKKYFLKKIQTSGVTRILRDKNAKFQGSVFILTGVYP